MLARIRTATEERDRGFTLIELLVVMIIIGILAAIAIPTFLNQRKNGYRSAVTTDLKNAATAVESWAVDRGGSYVGLTTAILTGTGATDAGFRGSSDVTMTVDAAPAPTASEYCLQATHASLSGETFRYLKSVGKPEKLACP